ncbi:triose-phosphate isomerase [Candidatus Peregrinibacteria bacterium]|nr:triose-phosphate isomerase [Candidatus Peregrinibacteria bacterium]
MKLPVIIVNFKVYQEATGENALKLARIHDEVAAETGASIGIAVNAVDLVNVIGTVKIPVFAQHVDHTGYGSWTGKVLAEQVKAVGCYGTLLNHAEYQIGNEELEQSVKKCHELGLFVIACAETPARAAEVKKFEPDLIAVEPPDLIGGDISVSRAEPGVIVEAVKIAGQGRLLVGAGVKSGEDVKIALQLGASGVLLASGVIKADDPKKALLDIVKGLDF